MVELSAPAIVPMETAANSIRQRASAEQAHARAAPDGAESRGSTIEHHFAENAEENLRRASARRPPDIHSQQSHHERHGSHVPKPFDILVPRANHLRLSKRAPRWTKSTARQEQPRNANGGNHERERVACERPLITELHHTTAAEKSADGERGPLRRLGE